jgi:hypothetical protein
MNGEERELPHQESRIKPYIKTVYQKPQINMKTNQKRNQTYLQEHKTNVTFRSVKAPRSALLAAAVN